ncbi:hypothetical protein ACQP00_29710 [Dactylosporangium sp. CS-047395]|uniref:hypothetical protein n=1 Tax=Dactylosporangium sp. CS-047395 TaxID=3239936 RepID=UPI003D8BC4E6
MDNPLLVHRLRALVAVFVCGSALFLIHAIDTSGRVVVARTGWVLALVVATYAAAGLATATAAYTFLQRRPERAKRWSNVATAFAIVVIVGFNTGWFLGLAVDDTL